MNIIDRINSFKEKIKRYFVSNKNLEWIDIDISNIKRIDITSVSDKNECYNDSKKFIKSSLDELNKGLDNDKKLYIGFVNLYTPEEAEMLNIQKPHRIKEGNFTFASVIEENINGEKYNSEKSSIKEGKIISFYSYKGGVGRTIALIQTAYLLADKGKKIAIIDLDIEAPSFNNIFQQSIRNKEGLVSYLYKKMYNIEDNETISDLKMITKLNIGTLGDVYVVPAGELDLEYVKMLEGLKEKRIYENGYILEFIKDITNRYNLDYILLDSRTGINNWGALSITDIADEVFLLAYPNRENIVGTNLILDIIKERKKCTVVFSRIDSSEIGIEKARKLFEEIDIEQEFIGITYDTAIALTDKFPIENRAMQYKEISEFILENEEILIKRQWISQNKDVVLNWLNNLSNRIYLNNVTTKLESKITEEQNSIIIINEKSNIKNIISSIEKNKNYEIHEISSEKYIKSFNEKICEEFERDIDIYVKEEINMMNIVYPDNLKLLLAVVIDEISENKINAEGILDEIFKNKVSKFEYIKKIKPILSKQNSKKNYYIINLDKLFSSLVFKEKEEEKKMIILNDILRSIDILVACDIKIKLVAEYKLLKKYENIFNEVVSNILNLSWNDFDKSLIKDNIKEILGEIYKLIISNLKEKNNDLNYLFPKRVDDDKYSKKLEEWLTNIVLSKMNEKNTGIGKEFILELIQKAAKIELKSNKEKNSAISFESIKRASVNDL